MLILVFIFLTPKSWFETTELQRSRTAQNTARQSVILGMDIVGRQPDRSEIERRVRLMTGRPDAQVGEIRQRRDPQGALLGYEVDIR